MQTIGQRENRGCSEIRVMGGQIITVNNENSERKKVKSKDLTLKSQRVVRHPSALPYELDYNQPRPTTLI